MISREEALQLLKKYLRNDRLLKHSLAVEAILKEMAKKLHEDEKLWGLTGLLHDMDFEYTKEDPERHTLFTAEMLEEMLPEEGIKAIKAHNYRYTGQLPTTGLDRALIATDAVSGLIIATALIIPTKRLADVQLQTLINKYKDNSFAAGCERKRIELCEDTGLPLEMFLELSLNALKGIADQLDL